MNFAKKLIGNEEERAVSPVIGVILMVAITVILAAVIAAFVLDLGNSMGNSAPTATYEWSQEENAAGEYTVTVQHTGGEDLEEGTLDVVVDSGGTVNTLSWASSGTTVSAGDSYEVFTDDPGVAPGDTIQIIWRSSDGGSSNVLTDYEVN